MSSYINQKIKGNNNTVTAIFNQNVSNISSALATLLPSIAKITISEVSSRNDTKSYNIEDKIEYNNIHSFKEILEEYGQYGYKIDALYEEYDNNFPGCTKSIFQYFRTKYLLKKEKLISQEPENTPITVIKKNADNILRDILMQFIEEIKAVREVEINLEALESCALCVVCHALINCKILEKPPNDCR